MDCLIKNILLLTMNEAMDQYPKGFIKIEGDAIAAAGSMENIPKQLSADCIIVDGGGAIALPAFINTHTHTGMIPFRSLGDDCPDRLRRFLFPLEQKAMTTGLACASARYAAAEMLLSGTGCFVDMYFFEDAIARSLRPMGVRAFLGETVADENQIDSPEGSPKNGMTGIALCEEFIRNWRRDPLITPLIAPHAPNTNAPETLRAAAALSRKYDVPLTRHLAEMDYETEYFRKNYNMSPIGFLDSIGMFSQPFIAAHCINVNSEDIQLLARRRITVSHCIGANTKSAKGTAPVKAMLDAGVPVALGTDGPASGNTLDMVTQMDLFAKFHKTKNMDRTLFPAEEIVRLATSGAAKALGISHLTGSIEAGKKADITLIETASVNMFPLHNPYSVLVYSVKAANVTSVFINGRLLVHQGKLSDVSLDDLRYELQMAMQDFMQDIVGGASPHFSLLGADGPAGSSAPPLLLVN